MSKPVLLDFEKHGKLRLSEPKDFTSHKTENFVPVVFQEFYELATEFPLVFIRNKKTGDFVPGAMMGLNQGVNLYCQIPEWQPVFIPATFTVTPLSVSKLDPDSNEADITIDEQSPLLSETVGEPLYQSDGLATDYLKKRIDHVVRVTQQSVQTIALCRYLAEKRLLTSRPLRLQHTESSPKYEVEGVYMIDENALEELSNGEFQELRERGLLPLIYSHLTSLQQIGRLTHLQYAADLEKAMG
ncbi:MAG: multidrug transporter [SAR86 cluster bacterium]|uniref:Multidrug transporter n=1 Tax=SAR86 cluster bacterium TaxID=2030880 RepID=A0A2A4X2S1_9GAMM|nr:MAG: multidrug transporter [SAR86 cluster bacterium]